jgi:hypothetical protein
MKNSSLRKKLNELHWDVWNYVRYVDFFYADEELFVDEMELDHMLMYRDKVEQSLQRLSKIADLKEIKQRVYEIDNRLLAVADKVAPLLAKSIRSVLMEEGQINHRHWWWFLDDVDVSTKSLLKRVVHCKISLD